MTSFQNLDLCKVIQLGIQATGLDCIAVKVSNEKTIAVFPSQSQANIFAMRLKRECYADVTKCDWVSGENYQVDFY